MLVIFIIAPKNSGLEEYREKTLKKLNPSKIIEVRAEDVPFWVTELQNKGQKTLGLIGEDLFREYCIKNENNNLKVIQRIEWNDPKALFQKPTLCLLGPKDKNLETLQKNLRIGIASKYKKIANNYLKLLEKKEFNFKKIYLKGSVEESYSENITDIIIDIVYSGNSMKKYNLKVYDKILQNDFLIIGSKK